MSIDSIDTLTDLIYLAWNHEHLGVPHDIGERLFYIIPELIELNNMIGMESIKKKMLKIVANRIQNHHGPADLLHTVLSGMPGTGKCLAPNTKLLQYGSVSTIKAKDVKIGDTLVGDDGNPRTVSSVCTGTETMYAVHTGESSFTSTYSVNSSHILTLMLTASPIITKDGERYNVSYIDATGYHTRIVSERKMHSVNGFLSTIPRCYTLLDMDISTYQSIPSRYRSCLKGVRVSIDYPYQAIDIDPYCFGVFAAGGSSSSFAESEFLTSKRVAKEWDRYLRLYNEDGEGCIAEKYIINSKSVRLQVLAGYVNTCSTSYIYRKLTADEIEDMMGVKYIELSFHSCCEICMKAIAFIGASLGFTVNASSSYLQLVCDPTMVTAVDGRILSYEPIRVVRKGVGEYCGFELKSSNGRFLLSDFTVTHNTTLANILANLYAKLGVLDSGHVVVASRAQMIGKYIGHSESQTTKLLDEAIGGVLLIDEAYSLSKGSSPDSFSKAVIDIINQRLTERGSEFVCIIAGYKKELDECFFSVNPGLKRRFTQIFEIEDYTSNDLTMLFLRRANKDGWKVADEDHLRQILKREFAAFKFFGGDIDSFFTECKFCHSLTTLLLSSSQKTLTPEDIEKGIMCFLKSREDAKDNNHLRMYL